MALGHVYKYSGKVLVAGKLISWKSEVNAVNKTSAITLLKKKFCEEAKIHPNTRILIRDKDVIEKEKVMW